MNDPRAGMPADPSVLLQGLELRVSALESELAGVKAHVMLDDAKVRSPQEEAIREASLVKALEIAAELFPSQAKPVLETMVDPEANEEWLVCTAWWDGDFEDLFAREQEWHRRVEQLPGLRPLEVTISVVPPHGCE